MTQYHILIFKIFVFTSTPFVFLKQVSKPVSVYSVVTGLLIDQFRTKVYLSRAFILPKSRLLIEEITIILYKVRDDDDEMMQHVF